MANVELTVGEILESADRDLGVSEWLRIDQDRIDLFAEATEDHHWIHVDSERARNGPFGTTIAHGYLTLSLVPRFLEDLLTITNQGRGANYGIERVRFLAPVREGSELRMRGRLNKVQARDDGGVQFNLGFEVEARDEDRPAMVGEVIYLTYPT
jgi:acyl dehydratase